MKEPINPFRLRSSESIDAQSTFLRFFGSDILNFLTDDCFINKVTVFRSGPGGGKTSLFRLFQPECLKEVSENHSDYKDLLKPLTEYGVIDSNGPQLLGVYLRLFDYAPFQDLHLGQHRYLFSLIGSRLIMKTLTGILTLKNLGINDLDRIKIGKPTDHYIAGSPLPCNGKKLYNWASGMEQNICEIINRFDVQNNSSIDLSNNIDHIYAIQPNNILLDDKPVITKVLVLLDDLHELTKSQREVLLDKIIPARLPVSIWIAERLEALELDELLPGIPGREYGQIYLEDLWAKNSFEDFMESISEKRAKSAKLDFETRSLHQHLEDNFDANRYNSKLEDISYQIKKRLHSISNKTNVYDQWINDQERKTEKPYDDAINWRILEIEITREEKNAQKKLFDLPLETNLAEPNSKLKATADFFIHNEFGLPYFFGFHKISKLATYNIEQFLEIAGRLFDEVISQQIKNGKNVISAEQQEKIIKNIAESYFERIPKATKNGRDIIKFLSSFKKFARMQTIQPNAPYIPGVTGIGITKKLCARLMDPEQQDERYKRLAKVLRSCIIHNYLKKCHNRQGGDEVIILYINRLLCANFDLPLGKGGWRRKSLDDLCEWLDRQSEVSEKIKNES